MISVLKQSALSNTDQDLVDAFIRKHGVASCPTAIVGPVCPATRELVTKIRRAERKNSSK